MAGVEGATVTETQILMNVDDIEIHELDASRTFWDDSDVDVPESDEISKILYVVIVGGDTTTVYARIRETKGHLTSLMNKETVNRVTVYEADIDLRSASIGMRNDRNAGPNRVAEFTASADFHEGDLQATIIENAYKLRDVDADNIEIEE